MEQRLRQLLDEGYGARMAAGYCWPWSDPIPGGGLKPDVVIGDWHRPWNNKKAPLTRRAGHAILGKRHAGFEQVGCVYTAQGFEYDYAGVIIGPDLVWRTDHWVAAARAQPRQPGQAGNRMQFDQAVRNTYKVLLTRGMRGATVYSTDTETQSLLESLVPASAARVAHRKAFPSAGRPTQGRRIGRRRRTTTRSLCLSPRTATNALPEQDHLGLGEARPRQRAIRMAWQTAFVAAGVTTVHPSRLGRPHLVGCEALCSSWSMKALSIKQPLAQLIIMGAKDVENRSRRTSFHGRLPST